MKAKNDGKSTLVDESLRVLRSAFAGIALLGLPINLLMLTGPLFMLQVYDRVLGSGSVPTLVVLAGMTIGLYVFYGLLEGIRARVLLRIGQRLDAQLSGASYECSVGLPIQLGAKAERLDPVRDLETVRQFLVGPGPAAIFDIPQGLGEPAWAAKTSLGCENPLQIPRTSGRRSNCLGSNWSDLNVLFGGAFGQPMTIHIKLINGIARHFTIFSLDACKIYGCVVDMPTLRRLVFICRINSPANEGNANIILFNLLAAGRVFCVLNSRLV